MYQPRRRMTEEEAKKDALDAESRLEWYEMAAEGRDYCGNKWPTKQNDKASSHSAASNKAFHRPLRTAGTNILNNANVNRVQDKTSTTTPKTSQILTELEIATHISKEGREVLKGIAKSQEQIQQTLKRTQMCLDRNRDTVNASVSLEKRWKEVGSIFPWPQHNCC